MNTIYYTEVDGVNNSMFEIAGCGGFQIATSKPGMAELFEPESEIVTFASRKELIEKVQHYLARPEERRVIARRAQLRAHREHTYEHRLNKLLDIALPERNGSSLQTASDNPDQQSKLR